MKYELLNSAQCADRLRVPVRWLKDMAKAGKIPSLRIGKRKLRFELQATEEAIAQLAATERQPPRKTIPGMEAVQ